MASSAVDLTHLARYTGGDAALNAEVLRLFDNQASELVERLQSIIDASDAQSWRTITHTLKGAARGIGASSGRHGAFGRALNGSSADHGRCVQHLAERRQRL